MTRRTLPCMIILLAFTLAAPTPASATTSTLHVSAVRDLAVTDPPPVSRAFRVVVVTGTVDGVKYTTEQMLTWGTHRMEVGQDYPVVKIDTHHVTVTVVDKKGRAGKESLDIVGVEEK